MSRESHDFFNFVSSMLQDIKEKESDSDRVNRVTALASGMKEASWNT